MNKDRKFFIIDNTGVFTQEYINNVEKYTKYIKSNNIAKVFCNNHETEYILKSLIYENCFYNKSDCVVEYKTDQELEKYLEKNDNFLYNYRQKKQMTDPKNIKISLIGNPPYQGEINGHGRASSAIWYKFLLPFYEKDYINEMCMIFPSKFLFGTGRGISAFSKLYLTGKYIKKTVIYPNSTEVFPDVKIEGGVCYTYFNKNINVDETKENPVNIKVIFGDYIEESTRPFIEKGRKTFVLYNKLNILINKLYNRKKNFSNLVESINAFGLETNFYNNIKHSEEKTDKYTLNIISYVLKKHSRTNIYVNESELLYNEKLKNFDKEYYYKNKDKYKVCFATVNGGYLNIKKFPIKKCIKPFIVGPGDIITQSYICILCDTEQIAKNIISYINTKFFNALLYTKTMTQHVNKGCFEYIPLQDFSQEWTDEKLYNLYKPLFEEKEYNDIWDFINLLSK